MQRVPAGAAGPGAASRDLVDQPVDQPDRAERGPRRATVGAGMRESGGVGGQ